MKGVLDMDNNYNYYVPNENETRGTIILEPDKPEEPKKKKKGGSGWKKVLACVGFAVLFGVVASLAFQSSNYLIGRITGAGNEAQSESTAGKEVSSTTVTQTSNTTVNSDVADVVKNAMPSVVSITNMSVQEVRDFFGGTQQRESQSSGSGIIIGQNDTELLIVTNNHVVENSSTLTVTFIDNESVEAQIKGTDSEKDLAVVAINLSDIKDSTMDEIKIATIGDSTKLQVGETTIAIGNALGYGSSVTSGIVSAVDRELDGFESKLIQTDAAINPGNSGGALLNMNGEVIGINTAKVSADAVEGMGYAIPISDASDVINTLMNRETRAKVDADEQGYLGIRGVGVSDEDAAVYGKPIGVYVSEVIKGGAADKAGINKGSIITKFDGTTIDSMSSLKELLQYYRVGETVEVTIEVPQTNGEYKEKTVEVTLGKNAS